MHSAIDDDKYFEGSTWSDAQVAAQVNYASFGALYLSQGKKDLGMAWHAEVSFRVALVEPHETPEQQYWAGLLVPVAATWLIQAATKIYDLCQNSNGVRGYSLRRWAFWKRRFLEIAAHEDLMISTRNMASRAASGMDTVDGEIQQCQMQP